MFWSWKDTKIRMFLASDTEKRAQWSVDRFVKKSIKLWALNMISFLIGSTYSHSDKLKKNPAELRDEKRKFLSNTEKIYLFSYSILSASPRKGEDLGFRIRVWHCPIEHDLLWCRGLLFHNSQCWTAHNPHPSRIWPHLNVLQGWVQ